MINTVSLPISLSSIDSRIDRAKILIIGPEVCTLSRIYLQMLHSPRQWGAEFVVILVLPSTSRVYCSKAETQVCNLMLEKGFCMETNGKRHVFEKE